MKKLESSNYRLFSIALTVGICFFALMLVGNIAMCIQDIVKSDYLLPISEAILEEWQGLSFSFIATVLCVVLKILFHKKYTKQ
ncbi:MAG: hypothetical protein J6R82_03730 [Clostridia bacterium]|nr:hypothetical protein [Clostridia bacterium]